MLVIILVSFIENGAVVCLLVCTHDGWKFLTGI